MFKSLEQLKEYLSDFYPDEEITIFENPSYHTAFIGVSDDTRAVYNYEKMVEFLVNEWTDEGIDFEYIDAVEFIDYNTIRALPYFENSPIIVYGIQE